MKLYQLFYFIANNTIKLKVHFNNPNRLKKTPNMKLKFILILVLIPFLGQAQKDQEGRFRTIQISGHTGGHFYGGDGLDEKSLAGYGAIELRLAWQNSNPDSWASQYGYPSYGVGLYSGFIGDPQIFGNPNAIFGFINFPISKPFRRNAFSLEPAFGLTYNLEPFNSETNPSNDAIGSRTTVYFNLNSGWTYKWTKELDIAYGIDFTHFSNGRSNTPNWGLNMFGVNLGLRYHYNADERKYNDDPYSERTLKARYLRPKRKLNTKVEDNHGINIYLAAGTVQNYPENEGDPFDESQYLTLSAVLDYQHKFNNMHGISAGLDYFFDASLSQGFPDDESKQHLMGIHGGYDFMFHKFTINGHAGTYLTDRSSKDPYYFRVALRYDLVDWSYAQIGLKTDAFSADWIEFGIGFRPFKW